MRWGALAVVLAALTWVGTAQAKVVWLCHPGMADDPCEIGLDTTVQRHGGTDAVVTPARAPAARRGIDCFYVYPTVSNKLGTNATQARDPEIVSIAKYQAAGFSSQCRMFAPIYRQIPLAGIAGLSLGDGDGAPARIAFDDVLEAWRAYLAQDNGGRGVVLIGHSQGSIMLRQLIRAEVEKHPAQRKRLVGAVLLGGNVTVPEGKTTGGDFADVPVCTAGGQVGCVTAYSTYSTDPGSASFFGNTDTDVTGAAFGLPSGKGFEVACTDPDALSGMRGPAGVTIPSEPFAAGPINAGIAVTNGGPPPSAATTWIQPPDRATGACKAINGANVYRYDPADEASRRPNEFPPAWGTHLLDMNLGVERLRRIVARQAAGWLGGHLRVRGGRRRVIVHAPGPGTVTVRRRSVRVMAPARVVVRVRHRRRATVTYRSAEGAVARRRVNLAAAPR